VFTGRVDGRVSLATEAARDLPSAGANFTTLQKLFAESDLDVVDLVALSGLPYLIFHISFFGNHICIYVTDKKPSELKANQ